MSFFGYFNFQDQVTKPIFFTYAQISKQDILQFYIPITRVVHVAVEGVCAVHIHLFILCSNVSMLDVDAAMFL